MYGQAHTKLENAVSDIQDKYRDIQKLEAVKSSYFCVFSNLKC